MINIYENITLGEFVKIDVITQNNWIQMLSPSDEETNQISTELEIPIDFLTDALDINERPRVEERGDITLLIIHIPYNDSNVINMYDEVKYRTIPLGIILTKNHFITVCREELTFDRTFFADKKVIHESQMNTRNTLAALNQTAHIYIQTIQEIEEAITKAEDELSRSYRNQELYTLLYLNESLLYMATSLKQMRHMMRKVNRDHYIEMLESDWELFEETMIELDQAYAVTEISQLNLNNVMDAYGNVIQNNVSHIVKLLTAVTIIFSIPTLIASIYGMNVPLPFQESPHAFNALIISMIVLSVIVTVIFHKKRYF